MKNQNGSSRINIDVLSLVSNIAHGMNKFSPVLQNIFDNLSMSTCNLQTHGNKANIPQLVKVVKILILIIKPIETPKPYSQRNME